MKPTTKVFATLSLAAAVGEKIMITGASTELRGAGEALKTAAFESARKYPSAAFSAKQVDIISESVHDLLSAKPDVEMILSMLIAGLSDIQAKCNPARHELLDSVIYPIQACMDFCHGDIDHESALDAYLAWAES